MQNKPSKPNYEVGIYLAGSRAFMPLYQCMTLVEAVNASTKMNGALPVLPEKMAKIGWQKCENYDPDCGVWRTRKIMAATGMDPLQADILQDAIDALPVSFKEESNV